MTDGAVALVVLAAGQGSRMLSDLPKVLHRLGGVPLVGHALAAGRSLDPDRTLRDAFYGPDHGHLTRAGYRLLGAMTTDAFAGGF